MATTSQLVRKGRNAPKKKLATPGLKSGKGRKKKVAAPLPDLRPGVDSFLLLGVRPLRTSWLVVGMRRAW